MTYTEFVAALARLSDQGWIVDHHERGVIRNAACECPLTAVAAAQGERYSLERALHAGRLFGAGRRSAAADIVLAADSDDDGCFGGVRDDLLDALGLTETQAC